MSMDKNELLLDEVYRNAKVGGDSIVDLIDRAEDGGLRGEMTGELEGYRRFESCARDELSKRGLKPTEMSAVAKMGQKAGMFMNTMLDTTTSHLAELMINGTQMGIIELEKRRNDCFSDGEADVSGSARALSEDLLQFEKKNLERLERYL